MKFKKIIIATIILLTLVFITCKKKFEGVLTNEIYLAPNDKEIIYVYEKNGESTICSFNIGDTQSRILIKKDGYNLSEPSFSSDGKKIIYRAWQSNNPTIHIFLCNSDGSKSTEVYKDNLLFAPKFSEYDSSQIYFIKASEYSNHSPIATQHPNGMDVYSYHLKSKKIKRLTEDNYYAINSYDFMDKTSFIVNCDLKGVFRYSLNSLKKEELNLRDKIDSSSIDQVYSSRVSYSKNDKKYLLSTYFDTYLWNGKDSKLAVIYNSPPGKQIKSTSFFKNRKNVFICDNNENIIIVDYNGKILNKFKIPNPDGSEMH